MLKASIAILIATTTSSALAANTVVFRHEVRFQDQTFICGEIRDRGKIRRFIHSIPEAKYIPELEQQASDPLAKSWQITYRIICEEGYHRPNLTSHLSRKKF
jgi:hypothetical protein